jgi:DivIVA domain-containing protein
VEEVNAFLDAIRDSFLGVRESSLTPDEIRDKRFSTTRLRPGYDEEEVDAFLDEAELRLATQASTGGRVPAAYQPSVVADSAVGAGEIRCLECGAEGAKATEVCARCGPPVAQRTSAAAGVASRHRKSMGPLDTPHESVSQRIGYSRLDALVMVAAGLAVLVAVIVHIAVTGQMAGQLTEDQLQPGDCLRGSNLGLGSGGTWPDYVTAVPCTQQHLAEVFFAGNAWPQSLTAYPGDNVISDQGSARCNTAFDETRTGHDGRPVLAGGARFHVRAAAPAT